MGTAAWARPHTTSRGLLRQPDKLEMACLILVLLFDVVVHRRVRAKNSTAGLGMQRFAGAMSLLLWSCVVIGGRAIGILMLSVTR